MSSSLDERAAEFRALRRQLEESILPLATSVDGRHFELQASLHGLELQIGGYVVLESDEGRRLGQVVALELARVDGSEVTTGDGALELRTRMTLRSARGEGVVLDGDGRPFHDAPVRPAEPSDVAAWLATTRPARATPSIGELLLAPGVPATLDAAGFDRHTFLCGQSGSGKTYSLGLVLERLLVETDLRLIVLDPNSDYVRLGEVRGGVDAQLAAGYDDAASGIVVRRAGGGLHLGIGQLDPRARAAALSLDPVADREEFALVDELLGEGVAIEELATSDEPHARALHLRIENLGVSRWPLWARGRPGSLVDDVEGRDARCLVVDLGSLSTREEQAVAAEAVLATLWRRRAEREPVLLVIDEAHNVCPQTPEDPVTALVTEHAVRIAAEGRKFGLYLLVSTQRPHKVHENVLSQCDNLLVMRMNSLADLGFVRDVFSFVPAGLLERATDFRQGEALVAGKIASHPCFVRFGARVAEEGGSDVPADWARARG
ncbi:MAG TPA: ATP-binding protein [Gaiellaceae bacterium]|nr:ATP-binding protein [Gaiellaceae bacterium]